MTDETGVSDARVFPLTAALRTRVSTAVKFWSPQTKGCLYPKMAAETGRSRGKNDDAIKNFPSVFSINLAVYIKNHTNRLNICRIIPSNPVDFGSIYGTLGTVLRPSVLTKDWVKM
jgi:hypothetical protein